MHKPKTLGVPSSLNDGRRVRRPWFLSFSRSRSGDHENKNTPFRRVSRVQRSSWRMYSILALRLGVISIGFTLSLLQYYSDLSQQPFSNARNDEISTNLDSPDDIRAIFDEVGGNVSKLLTTSSQSIFEELELSWLQQNDTSFFEYPFETLQNMFRQGNSLREAFFSLQKHNNSWNGNNDCVCIFARSDTFLMSPVDIPTSVGRVDVIVPNWHGWGGYNDRFALAGPDAAKVYATKVEGYKEAILALRRRHTFEVLPSLTNSETLLKNWLLENKLSVTELEDDRAWALLRVRADGRIEPKDLDEFEIENASLVEDLAASELD